MARRIEIELVGDSRSLERAFAKSSRSAQKFNKTLTGQFRGTIRATNSLASSLLGISAGFVGVAGAAALVKVGFDEMAQAQKVTAQTAAVLESTGRVAGVTAEHVDTLAESLLRLSGVDDELIRQSENVLLTFTGIRNEAGKGNNIFDQATKLTLDMSVALGTDLRQASIRVGKALQDPVRGVTALRRAGVVFTRAQEKQIKALVQSGQAVKAQRIILAELTREFGGSAQAAGTTLPGKLDILRESLKNLAGTIVQKLSPKLTEVVNKFNAWLQDPKHQKEVIDGITTSIKDLAAAAETAAAALAKVVEWIKWLDKHRGPSGLDVYKKLNDIKGPSLLDVAQKIGLIGDEAGKSAGDVQALATAMHGLDAIESARLRRDVRPARRTPIAGPTPRVGITAAQRNQWFDVRLARQLDRVQDLGLRKQLGRLKLLAAEVKARIAITTDATRRNNLEDQYLGILRQQRSVQEQITDQVKAANQALKDRADAIKSAVIEKLQRRQTDILNKRAMTDAQDALRLAKALGGPMGIRAAKRTVQDVRTDQLMARLERQPATLTKGGRFALGNIITINVHGVTDPDAVARKVTQILKQRQKHTTTQSRGATAGA